MSYSRPKRTYGETKDENGELAKPTLSNSNFSNELESMKNFLPIIPNGIPCTSTNAFLHNGEYSRVDDDESRMLLEQLNQNEFEDSDIEDSNSLLKKSGRRKIKIEYIGDKIKRHVTFSKRKGGLMKKAYELSTLTGTQVLLLVASETGYVYTFATPKFQPIVSQNEGKSMIQRCLGNPESYRIPLTPQAANIPTSISKSNKCYNSQPAALSPKSPSEQFQKDSLSAIENYALESSKKFSANNLPFSNEQFLSESLLFSEENDNQYLSHSYWPVPSSSEETPNLTLPNFYIPSKNCHTSVDDSQN